MRLSKPPDTKVRRKENSIANLIVVNERVWFIWEDYLEPFVLVRYERLVLKPTR